MIGQQRINLIVQMGGEIIEMATRIHRIEYRVTPSQKIDNSDIRSLRGARYHVEYGRRSEWLDIEELAALAHLIVQQKAAFESVQLKPQPGVTELKINVTIPGEPPDDLILAVASKMTFSDPPVLN